MKRIAALLLTFVMLLSLVPAIIAAEPTHGYICGDVDDDTRLTAKDTLLLKKYLSSVTESRDINELAADVNGDGRVGTNDLLTLKNILIGSSDPIGNNTDKKYRVDTVTIAGMNISRYDIVLGEGYSECTEYSAKKLRDFIGSACGIYPNVTYDSSKHWIKFMFDPDDNYSLGKEGYKITVTQGGDVEIYCGTMRGPFYAAIYLAEEFLGYRFLTDYNKYLYEAENVDLPMGFTECEVPTLTYRSISQNGVDGNTGRYLRDNSCDGSVSGNSDPKDGGAVGTVYIHAHSYAYQMNLTDLKSQPTDAQNQEQPCLTDEETYDKIIAYNDMLLEDRTSRGSILGINYTQVSVSPNDNTNFCHCDACKKIYLEEGSIAGTVFRLSNRVAKLYETKYPGLEIYTIAYWDARNPPKYTRPNDNVVVCFCFGGCNNHSYDETEKCVECGGNKRLQNVDWQGNSFNQSNAVDIDYYKKWTELTNNIYIWYYSCNFGYSLSPAPNLFNVYNDIKFVAANGGAGIYFEGSTDTCVYSFERLRGYLASKVAWDPFMSEEEYNEHMNEYLSLYYGEGWKYLREYIELVDAASDELGCWTNNYDRPFNINNEQFFHDNYDYLDELFQKAYDTASTWTYKKHIRTTRMHCDFLGLSATYEDSWVNGDNESRAKYAERYARLYERVIDENVRVASLGDDHGCWNFPKNSDVMNPMEWLWEGCTGYWINVNGYWQ